MFHRIIYDHWTEAVPILGFLLTFAVFLTALIRAFLMKKDECDRMATLPLEGRSRASSDRRETRPPAPES